MAHLASMIVRIPQAELLSAIWYSDGSGARGCGVETLDPDDYSVRAVETEGDNVLLTLGRKETA